MRDDKEKKTSGFLVITVREGEGCTIGDDIIVMVSRRKGRGVALAIKTTPRLKIDRVDGDGNKPA